VSTPLPPVTDLIPHRGRYLLIDRLTSLEGDTIEAQGNFEPADVEGHFPGQPVVPGVLLLEGLAQTMLCLHLSHPDTEQGTPYLTGFEKVRFRAPVLPPATVTYRVTLGEIRMGIVRASGTVFLDGKRVCNARLSGVIMPADGSAPTGGAGSAS
jgi:3-hydroxymyristoyl/3-hydroxydecanoyl-(acyl carrier protein) dehydratase